MSNGGTLSVRNQQSAVTAADRTYLSVISPTSTARNKTPEIFCADPSLLARVNIARFLRKEESNPGEICLELARPTARLPFSTGQTIRVVYWEERGIVYCWEAAVTGVKGPHNQYVSIRFVDRGVTLQRRRAYRVKTNVPFSLTVVDTSAEDLIGGVFNSTTENIGEGGLAFATSLPLQVGDKLAITLSLPERQRITLVAWVLRAEPTQDTNGNWVSNVGVKFLHLPHYEQARLLEFLAGFAQDSQDSH